MTSTAPGGPDASPPPTSAASTVRRSWWWVVVVTAAGLAVLLLVVQPWQSHETEPVVVPTTAAPTRTDAGGLTPGTSPSPTVAPVPGQDAEFDDDALHLLFLRPSELRSVVPAAQDGVTPGIRPGELAWGLPEGATVDPARCTVAVTVVEEAPPGFDARSWSNDAMDYTQTLTRLDDAQEAQDAFRELVTAVDGCPTYAQVDAPQDAATGDGATGDPGAGDPGAGDAGADARWDAQPAIEGQGTYPSIVQEVVRVAGGSRTPTYRGHLLVGNVIVSWTAAALADGDDDAARLATLGTPEALSMMVQDRARLAVQSLG